MSIALDKCTVTGAILRADGTPLNNATVVFIVSGREHDGDVVVLPAPVKVAVGLSGNITARLWPNARGLAGTNYTATAYVTTGAEVTTYATWTLVVPDAPTANLADISDLVPAESVDDATAQVILARAARDEAREARDDTQSLRDEVMPLAAPVAAVAAIIDDVTAVAGALPAPDDPDLTVEPGKLATRGSVEANFSARTPKRRYGAVALMLADTATTYAVVTEGDSIEAGGYRYAVAAADASDHHLEMAGGTKLYVLWGADGLDPAQLGALCNGIDDDGPFVERAFQITKAVRFAAGATYILASVIGLPDQTIYAPKAYEVSAEGATIVLDGVAAGDAIITSASAKADPESTSNLYVGKVNITGGNYTQRSPSVLINGDRVYNVKISINASAITSVIKSYRPKGGGYAYGYLQSVRFDNCHFSNIAKIVDAKRAFNFSWGVNFCEACDAGIYIDGPDTPAVTGLTIADGGHFEGGGIFLRAGSVYGGKIGKVYLEGNSAGDTPTEKCYIKIGAGGARSFSVDLGVFAWPSTAQRDDGDFYVFKDDASIPGTSVRGSYTNSIRLWQPGKVLSNDSNAVGNLTAAAALATRAPLAAQEAGVSFAARSALLPLASIVDSGKIRVATISVANLKVAFAATSAGRSASGVIYSSLRIMTAGQIVSGAAMAVIDFVAMGSSINVASGALDDVYVGFALRSIAQAPAGQMIETTYNNLTRQHWTAPALTVIKSGDIYALWLDNFAAGPGLVNYGALTQAAIEVTSQVNGYRHFTRDWAPLVLAAT